MKVNSISEMYYIALKSKYQSQIDEARANLALYMSPQNLAAIGEHSDLLTEHDKWIEKYTEAKDKLAAIIELYEN